jgi:hypothetical protein
MVANGRVLGDEGNVLPSTSSKITGVEILLSTGKEGGLFCWENRRFPFWKK